ncbi:phytanoyl-CoA dioxygenase family protein [Dictyobacter kobayashii]|uniref:Phytanoyl-CoA dioxygenase n=1 Tax=Dictyobacter kobayashii TaxID=2014872 RepID=A0A402AY44_9CHLR|nr:phytanoyl-CoA dioxygenase family protein [Dictyobacter kobayashii]GCE24008.1 phytanoyl-CoA dioxygenase [Dictyobacter kobayashii]
MSTQMRALSLISNGYQLAQTPQRLGWLEPTDPTLPIEQLRQRYRAAGYLWLKGILNRETVLTFRRRVFEAMQVSGLLAKDSDSEEGIYAGWIEHKELAHKIFMEVHRWPEYEAFCTAPEIVRFYEAFLGGEIYLHKRKLIRYNVPGDARSTGAHYDLVYLRGGTDRLCSSWIPLGDTPVELGGLTYLEGSDALGRKMEAEFALKNADLPPEERISAFNKNMREGWLTNNLPELAERINSRWLIADYEIGDMVIHSPYMIHAATVNYDPHGCIRLSTDIRYQLKDDDIDMRWTNHYYPEICFSCLYTLFLFQSCLLQQWNKC